MKIFLVSCQKENIFAAFLSWECFIFFKGFLLSTQSHSANETAFIEVLINVRQVKVIAI